MKKLKKQIHNHGVFLASLLLTSVIVLPIMRTSVRPMTIQEFVFLSQLRNIIGITVLRAMLFALVLINATFVYLLLSNWFAKRRAGLSIFVLASMPIWLLTQVTMPRFTTVLTPVLLALWSFDRAGRSDRHTSLWYALCGVATTAAWLQEPVGVTIVMLAGLALLAAIKPRYVKHIARQASLVVIILVATAAIVSAASWKFGFGLQNYLVQQLSPTIHITLLPSILYKGPMSYYFGIPGVSLLPLSIVVLAGLGAWQLFVTRKRPRNVFVLILPILLSVIALQFTGVTALFLLSIALIGVAMWTVMGIQYLHSSWKRVFPHNKLANSFGDLLIATMLASLAVYSFWYINRGWNGNPQSKQDAHIEWQGQL